MAMDKTTLRVLNKLFDKGYTTEKAIAGITLEDIRKIECYSEQEVVTIISLKEAVKANKVIGFLAGVKEEKKTNQSSI